MRPASTDPTCGSECSGPNLTAVDRVHQWAVCAWFVGMMVSPPLEGVAFGVLGVAAVIRWRTFWALVDARQPVRWAVYLYVGLMAWVAVTSLWGPGEGDGLRDFRLMVAPLAVVHARPSARALAGALLLGGSVWAVIGACELAGIDVSPSLQPPHITRTFLGLQLLGIASFAVLLCARGWRPLTLALGCSALWVAGVMHWATRTTAIACVAAAGLTATQRHGATRTLAIGTMCLVAAGVGVALLAPNTPLVKKVNTKLKQLAAASDGDAVLPSAEQVDDFLSKRLVIWDWTVSQSDSGIGWGRGFGSWKAEFSAACEHGLVVPSWGEAKKVRLAHITHGHNIFLQVLYEQGVIGLVLLGGFLAALWGTVRCHSDSLLTTLGIMSLATFVLVKCTSGGEVLSRASTTYFALFLSLAGSAAGVPSDSRQRGTNTTSPPCE